jgi:hypothetical protein
MYQEKEKIIKELNTLPKNTYNTLHSPGHGNTGKGSLPNVSYII